MSQAPPPQLQKGPDWKHEPDVGCTLVVKNLEPGMFGLPSESSYLSVFETADEIEDKIKNLKRWQKLITVTRNDYTVWSGQKLRINPDYIVSIT